MLSRYTANRRSSTLRSGPEALQGDIYKTVTLFMRTHPMVKVARAEEGEVRNEENRPRVKKSIDEQEEQQVTERQEVRALRDWSKRPVTQQR